MIVPRTKGFTASKVSRHSRIKKPIRGGVREAAPSPLHCFSASGSCFVVPCECGEHSSWGSGHGFQCPSALLLAALNVTCPTLISSLPGAAPPASESI